MRAGIAPEGVRNSSKDGADASISASAFVESGVGMAMVEVELEVELSLEATPDLVER